MVSDGDLLRVSFRLWTIRLNDGTRFVTDIPHAVVLEVSKRHANCDDVADELESMVGDGVLYDHFFRVSDDSRQGIADAVRDRFKIFGAKVSAQWGW